MHSILVVDDDKEICELLVRLLSRGNERVVEAAYTAATALQSVARNRYSLVIADYILDADYTGLDVLFEAKKHQPNIITILITGHDSDLTATRAVAEGVYDYLTKPFRSILEVKNTVERGLRYYALLTRYNEMVADEALQRELLTETLEKARRTRDILRMLVKKMGKDPLAGGLGGE